MEPLEAWRRLGYRQRMDVLYHARQGRPHPDPEMAATAVGWARSWRAQPLSRHVLSALGFTLKLYALLALALLATLLTGGTASIEPGSTILGSWRATSSPPPRSSPRGCCGSAPTRPRWSGCTRASR